MFADFDDFEYVKGTHAHARTIQQNKTKYTKQNKTYNTKQHTQIAKFHSEKYVFLEAINLGYREGRKYCVSEKNFYALHNTTQHTTLHNKHINTTEKYMFGSDKFRTFGVYEIHR